MESGPAVSPAYVARPMRLQPFRARALDPARIGPHASRRAFARPYRAVSDRLARWERQGKALRDPAAALYLHELTSGGLTVRGLVGALDLRSNTQRIADAAVLPHEAIHPEQAADLAERLRATGVDPAPILLVHRGTGALRALLDQVQGRSPLRELTDRGEQRHRLWTITDAGDLDLVTRELGGTSALIADGHHRYAAHLQVHREHPGPGTGAGLAMLVDQTDSPLYLGAIHRSFAGIALRELGEAAERAGARTVTLTAADALDLLAPGVLVASDGVNWLVVRLPPGAHAAVEFLHDQVLPRLPRGSAAVHHHHSVDAALGALRQHPGVAVLVPAPSLDDVLDAARSGRLLPEKATSFQPKPHVGVLIRSMHDG